ncbi:DUF2334 domain-containing protein [Methanothermococcus sp.]|uniref:DUF2334 domain-containing protein n=1 Tax=Methanothermococcus sp. TaxID=2614238 RepID=UPI0025EF2454|nr:DUF2334 domain-containing protein [Methanothermococcus sp.]
MKNAVYIVILILITILTVSFATLFFTVQNFKMELNIDNMTNVDNNIKFTFNEPKKPIILVHDVSPIYLKELKEIVNIINRNNYQNRTFLFIIVNHANKYNIENYPNFVKYLQFLEKEGYHLEYHAYNHIGGEYNCNKTVAEKKLNESFKILNDCGIDTKKIKYFIPPRYKISKDSEEVFLNKNISIIMDYYLLKKDNNSMEKIIITNKEYTWYMPKNLVKITELLAISDYKTSQHQFYLSIHPKAVNYGGGLEFLNYFLNTTKN